MERVITQPAENGMATGTIHNQTLDLAFSPGTYSLTLATAYGVVTGGGTVCSIYIPVPKSLARVSRVSVTLLSISLRHTGGGYIGGSSDFNALPYSDGTPSISSNGQLYINIVRSSGWGVTNNTPVAGTLDIRFTLS